MYGARPIRRWVQENVTTMISEMLVKGEAGPGSTIFVDATDDKKGLKYEVVNEVVDPVAGLPSDSGDDSDDLVVATPTRNGNRPENMRRQKTKLAACVTSRSLENLYFPIKALLARLNA